MTLADASFPAMPHATADAGVVRMYLANLAPAATQEEVEALVRPIVAYRRLHMIRNMRHGLCARFAFVDIDADDEPALRKGLDGVLFFGRTIGVLRVLARPDRLGPDGV